MGHLKLVKSHYDKNMDDFYDAGVSGFEALERIAKGEKLPSLKELMDEYKTGQLVSFKSDGRFWTRTLAVSEKFEQNSDILLSYSNLFRGFPNNRIALIDLDSTNFEIQEKNGTTHLILKNPESTIFEKPQSGFYKFEGIVPKEKTSQLDSDSFFLHSSELTRATLVSGFEYMFGSSNNIHFGDNLSRQLGLLEYE